MRLGTPGKLVLTGGGYAGPRGCRALPVEEFDERLALVRAKYHKKARTLALHPQGPDRD
jgi:hypothetical protein